ncbi:hypothetical protein M422DRAFT_38004 [Sphaerobolus stellatus SS14]|uniref:P-loop containing nucleoside triphosphate hydrolase protein n=1 Tax=Sphaerobolus stellatus (strain SS14) TaxID=990650 RepID=A0A0C9UCU1_SPHS4|nr:hypothetical protein M422DRAFT_38004 [Sphaerobolus stellatus SS14]
MASSTATVRPNQAPVKVICVGLGRTGTFSLSKALETLGFGPAYHLTTLVHERNDFPFWMRLSENGGSPEQFDDIFAGFVSILDYPAVMHAAELLEAYPEAKFIFSDRDPAKWEQSIHSTFMDLVDLAKREDNSPLVKDFLDWGINCVGISPQTA